MAAIETLFDAAHIGRRVEDLAVEIRGRMGAEFVMLGLLKGSFVFVADLARALHRAGARPTIEFMRLSSYGMATESAGEVHLIGDVPTDVSGLDILLVDDIVDTGRSVAYAQVLLTQRDVGKLSTCALLDKPSRREVPVRVDFVGFEVEDVFVAGYGIDYAEQYRYLPEIVVIR